ncbi:MAG: ComF family protein [Bacteroidota bacterium]|jgi:ComF family protein
MLHTLYKSFAAPVLEFIYPPVCAACGQRLDGETTIVCSQCWLSFREVHRNDEVWLELEARLVAGNAVQDILSCFLFEKEGPLQLTIHLLKYQGMKSLGVRLGREIGKRIQSNCSFSSADYLVPVPLHRSKERERGYNQSDYICKGIAETTLLRVHPSLLKRNKYTQSQTQLSIEQRNENVDDAFEVHQPFESDVGGKMFILVDDVITTGSTIAACARVLTAHGAKRVLAASVALAQ